MNNGTIDNQRIVFLDYLRIFAFLAVLIGHKFRPKMLEIIPDESIHATPRFLLELLNHFIIGGGAGIVVFFLVSGYIITHVLQSERPVDFFIKRIFRIYPLYMAAVLLHTVTNFYFYDKVPQASILIPQLLLVGDLYGTPPALGGVDWTLRVEMAFYLFMGILRSLNIMHKFKALLPWGLIATAVLLYQIAPLPSAGFVVGYLTIYGPFLLLGSLCYLKQVKQIGPGLLVAGFAIILYQYFILIEIYHPLWSNTHFASLGTGLFVFAWVLRARLSLTPFVLLLSELTYSVYLFHNWLWELIKIPAEKLALPWIHIDIQVLFLLFAFCYLTVVLIEKPGIQLGKKILNRLKKAWPASLETSDQRASGRIN